MITITTNGIAIWINNEEKEQICIPISTITLIRRLLDSDSNKSIVYIENVDFNLELHFKEAGEALDFMTQVYQGTNHNIQYNGCFELKCYYPECCYPETK